MRQGAFDQVHDGQAVNLHNARHRTQKRDFHENATYSESNPTVFTLFLHRLELFLRSISTRKHTKKLGFHSRMISHGTH